jgi:hypothetical protein
MKATNKTITTKTTKPECQIKPTCKLLGEDGNIFNLMAVTGRALQRANLTEQKTKMMKEVMSQHSYSDALATIAKYVDIT